MRMANGGRRKIADAQLAAELTPVQPRYNGINERLDAGDFSIIASVLRELAEQGDIGTRAEPQ